jgi:hypothetical protein
MVNFPTAVVCRRCSKPLSANCPDCGREVTPGAVFCPACGTILAEGKVVDVSAYKNKSSRSRGYDEERTQMGLGKKEVALAKSAIKSKAPGVRECPECAATISREAVYCVHCGAMFDSLLDASENPLFGVAVPETSGAPKSTPPAAKPKTPPPKAAPPAPAVKPATPTAEDAPPPAAKPATPTPKAAPTPAARPATPTPKAASPPAARPAAPTPKAAPPAARPVAKPSAPAAAAKPPASPPKPIVADESKPAERPLPLSLQGKARSAPTTPGAAPPAQVAAGPAPAAPDAGATGAAKAATRPGRKAPRPTPAAAVPPPVPLAPPEPAKVAPATPPTGRPRAELNLTMLPVNGATFQHPAHPEKAVAVGGFYLAAEPVTCAQYAVFLKATGHPAPVDWLDGEYLPGKANHPVVMVTLLDALAFCRWAGVRLPKADEWLAACVGKSALKYPWANGGPPPELLGGTTTRAVDAFAPYRGPFGHICLLGDVQQWLFEPAPDGDKTGDPEAPTGVFGIGGSSYLDPLWVGANGRSSPVHNPLIADFHIGFRCATDSMA